MGTAEAEKRFATILLNEYGTGFAKGDAEAENIFATTLSHPDIINVPYSSFRLSKHPMQPLFSRGYCDCNGVALINGVYGGLSHFDFSYKEPEEYMANFIRGMRKKAGSNFVAVLVGGDKTHMKRNERILNESRIPIIGKYCDGWNDEFERMIKGTGMGSKSVLVMPTAGEIIIRSKSGYRRFKR